MKVDTKSELDTLREDIKKIDNEILMAIKKRIAIMKHIGKVKKRENQPIRNREVEKEKLQEVRYISKTLAIPMQITDTLWKLFFSLSEDIQKHE